MRAQPRSLGTRPGCDGNDELGWCLGFGLALNDLTAKEGTSSSFPALVLDRLLKGQCLFLILFVALTFEPHLISTPPSFTLRSVQLLRATAYITSTDLGEAGQILPVCH